MSTQSIIHNSDTKVAQQLNNYFYQKGTKYILYKRFAIGENPVDDIFPTISRLHRIFCNDYCEISEEDMRLIKEIINNELIFNNPEL